MRTSEELKRAAVEQWTHDPAGALNASSQSGTREFFEEVERGRYELYPWLRGYLAGSEWGGKRVLEIGVGLGTDHLQLARAGAILTGVDLTSRSIEETRRRFQLYRERSELLIADGESLPFEDGSFDAVYSFGVLHHTPDMAQAVREVGRVLRPGGRALIGLYNRHSYFYAWRLARYLIRGEWRASSIADMKARFEHGEGNPLVVVSSRRELKELFSRSFSRTSINARHVPRARLPERIRLSLEPALDRIERSFGWYWIVEATR